MVWAVARMTVVNRIPLHTQHLRAYQVGDGVIVLHQPSASLHVIEGIGCWLFLGLDQGLSEQQLRAEYAQAYPENHMPEGQWAGMLASITPLLATHAGHAAYEEEYMGILRAAPSVPHADDAACFHLNGLGFQVLSDTPKLLEVIRKLALGDGLPWDGSIPIRCQFDVRQDTIANLGTYQITCNGHLLTRYVPFAGVLPLLMDHIQIMTYQSQEYLLAIHAAAVVKDGMALILPGVSGSGKSTLCISLVEQGFECYSDELAVLSYPSGKLQSLPLPMAVKTGSWSLLETAWPILKQAPIWQRPDGRQLKYIPLPDHARPVVSAGIRQQYVIFPHYDADIANASLQPVSPLQMLGRLAAAGYQIKNTLDVDKVERLISFAQQTPAYSLHYADLGQARCHIETLMGQPIQLSRA